MRTIILAVAAILTAGTATAQTASPPNTNPFIPHEEGDEIKIVTKVGCLTYWKTLNSMVNATPDGTTVISSSRDTIVVSDGETYAIGPEGKRILSVSPDPTYGDLRVYTDMALIHQKECNKAIKEINR